MSAGRDDEPVPKAVFQLTFRASGGASLAEETTAESFYKIWRKAYQWRDDTRLGAWIRRITVRTVLDLNRSQGR